MQGFNLQGYPPGFVRFLMGTTAGVAADETVTIQPPVGKKYLVLGGWGAHNDGGAARIVQWYWGDGTNAMMQPGVAQLKDLPNNVYALDPASSRTNCDFMYPIMLDANTYLKLYVYGLVVGQKGYYRLVVIEFRGMEPVTNA